MHAKTSCCKTLMSANRSVNLLTNQIYYRRLAIVVLDSHGTVLQDIKQSIKHTGTFNKLLHIILN